MLSLADVTKILKISKRKAAWLLQSGYIECNNSGKKTRQYQVKIDDLFEYMDKVERNDPSVQIPPGIFSSKTRKKPRNMQPLERRYMNKSLLEDFKIWLDDVWLNVPEKLTINEVAQITGEDTSAVQRWIQQKKLCSARLTNKSLITTKEWLIEFCYNEWEIKK